MLVTQAALDEVKQWAVTATKEHSNGKLGTIRQCGRHHLAGRRAALSPAIFFLQLLAGHSDHHAVGKGGLQAVPGELTDHLTHSQAVILPHMVQQS